MLDVLVVVILAIPAVLVVMVGRDLLFAATDEAARWIISRREVARRAPYYRALWKLGGVLQVVPLVLLAAGIRGSASADQWRTLGLASAGLVTLGTLLQAAWWGLAGRKLRRRQRP